MAEVIFYETEDIERAERILSKGVGFYVFRTTLYQYV